jgi:hypothetical protein
VANVHAAGRGIPLDRDASAEGGQDSGDGAVGRQPGRAVSVQDCKEPAKRYVKLGITVDTLLDPRRAGTVPKKYPAG